MERLGIKVKEGSHFEHLTEEQIQEICSNFCVQLPENGLIAIWSEEAPCDTRYPWQPINGCGEPVGKVKKFTNGYWQ